MNITESLVQRLVGQQFPELSELPITPVPSAGTDNALYRLGANLVVRLPARESAAKGVAREQTWLPRLAPHLPLPVPAPIKRGEPCDIFPWPWSICAWLEGRDAQQTGVADLSAAAITLGGFVKALHAIDATGGPLAGADNHGRGLPLARFDARVRHDLQRLGDEIDGQAVLRVWESALGAQVWSRPGVWVHGDLHPGNLLVERGRIVGVLDFGLIGVGDPACDLTVAWSLFDGPSRAHFRQAVGADDSMWRRGRGWAVYGAIIDIAFYRDSNPAACAMSRRTLAAAVAG